VKIETIRTMPDIKYDSFVVTMEKLRVVGYDWPEIIEKVTKAPAENFHLTQKGTLDSLATRVNPLESVNVFSSA
jgi:predicted amidohydrolase